MPSCIAARCPDACLEARAHAHTHAPPQGNSWRFVTWMMSHVMCAWELTEVACVRVWQPSQACTTHIMGTCTGVCSWPSRACHHCHAQQSLSRSLCQLLLHACACALCNACDLCMHPRLHLTIRTRSVYARTGAARAAASNPRVFLQRQVLAPRKRYGAERASV